MQQRPELRYGLVEWVAPPEFTKRPPQQPNYLFVVDVSYVAASSGLLAQWFSAIEEVLERIQDDRVNVGFVTYNRNVQFYHFNKGSTRLRCTVAHQLEQVGSPIPEGVLFNLATERFKVQQIMRSIEAAESSNPVGASCNGAAMMAGASVLDLHGGKVMMFVAAGASCGPGHSAKSRNEKGLIGTDKEKELYQPQDNFWRRLGAACVKRFVSVDIFAVSNTNMDMASLSHVSKVTAGQVYFNTAEGQHYRNTVMMNLNRNMQRNQGWEAVMRIRVSKGLEISNYYGNFNMWTDHDMDIVSVDCDKAVAVQFKYVDDLLKHPVCIQAAMLYTNRVSFTSELMAVVDCYCLQLGERRIRVLTQQLTITSQLANVFRGADVDAIMNFSLRGCLQACITSTIQAARDSVLKRTINSLHAYRRYSFTACCLCLLSASEDLDRSLIP